MADKSELISPAFRVNFREYCVANLVLRQIDDAFTTAGIRKRSTDYTRQLSGQRRTLVEEYYSSVNWADLKDVEKYLNAVQFVYALNYGGNEEPRKRLKLLLEMEGFVVEGWKIRRITETQKQPSTSILNVDDTIFKPLRDQLIMLNSIDPQRRGFDFERLLNQLFKVFNLEPRGSFRLIGEQIDGSFEISSDVYLLEAKWQSSQTSQKDLLAFREQVESKSAWTRGLFVSYAGFSSDGLVAFSRGRATNIIGMDGQDLYHILNGQISLSEAIVKKARRAAETGEFFVSVFELIH